MRGGVRTFEYFFEVKLVWEPCVKDGGKRDYYSNYVRPEQIRNATESIGGYCRQ